jgi:DNA-binding NtrC family response regulator
VDTKSTLVGARRDHGAVGLHLLIMSDQQLHTVPLPAKGVLTIGRSARADIRLDDPRASREHVRLYLGATVYVEDPGSANGTRLRDHFITRGRRIALVPGEAITIGATVLMVQHNGFASSPAPPVEVGTTAPRAPSPEATSTSMQEVLTLASRAAQNAINVLILGETGVGKEVLARRIHEMSPRARAPLLAVNCAGLSETLIDSELFGHEKGAFTGATAAKPGLIEGAHGGTVFLDEIGEMPPALQAKLLRMIETREVQRLGALKPRQVDVRFIAATNRDLEAEVTRNAFRCDLFFRLNGISLLIPPLRERRTEIGRLATRFVAEACQRAGRRTLPISAGALERLHQHEWPGNIRELKNVIERAVVVCEDGEITAAHLTLKGTAGPSSRGPAVPEPLTPPAGDEHRRILEALATCGGNQTRAAVVLGISRRTLSSRLDRYHITRPKKPS